MTDYTRAINLYPDKGSVYHARGVTFFRKNLFERAVSDYKDALRRGIRSAELYYDLGLSFYKAGNSSDAIRAFTRAIEVNPQSKVVEKEEKKARKKRRKRSKKSQAKADIKVNAARAALKSAYFKRGVALKSVGLFDGAAEDFTKVIEIDPEDADALNNRGYLYLVEVDQTEKGCEDLTAACTLGECANLKVAEEKRDVRG